MLTNKLSTTPVDKWSALYLPLLALLCSGCVVLPESEEGHRHGPGCGHGSAAQLSIPYHIPEQSLRLPPHAIPHANHIPPLPGEGDVIYAKQNRYPVTARFEHTPPHDAGAAYDMAVHQHVLTRSTTARIPNGWDSNPLGVRQHYRDPECFHPPTGLADGLVDRCGEAKTQAIEPPPQSRIIRAAPMPEELVAAPPVAAAPAPTAPPVVSSGPTQRGPFVGTRTLENGAVQDCFRETLPDGRQEVNCYDVK